ncbi:Uncharacterised protein [Vibrio cholerae]|uniref:Uncharacterized protein n=1 Tax=Vibrio cholerae TaxID=666 RepID=A0A655WWY2_VIBCL|nr:Uncharacterised protein [Vibrio cholerae]CSB99915.1 Uncharacterised protein [Vibrio cholerae]CSC39398.1 Uncharacterised protein [Vibrio cholerae]
MGITESPQGAGKACIHLTGLSKEERVTNPKLLLVIVKKLVTDVLIVWLCCALRSDVPQCGSLLHAQKSRPDSSITYVASSGIH